MPQFKNNHTIPKCLIKEWAVEGPNYFGAHVYEYESDKAYFSTGKGSGAYSFAIEPGIYVAQKNEKRIVAVEKWFADVENTLSIFLQEVKKNHGSYLVKDEKYFHLLLLALFSLRHRSKYNLASIRKFLEKNPGYKDKVSSDNELNLDILILENLIHSTTEDALRFANCELVIAQNREGGLILGDRPFLFDKKQDDYSFIPVTPHLLISIRKINEPSYYFNETTLPDEMVHNFNQMIAENSRQWIVAASGDQLQRYIPFTKVEREEEAPIYEAVEKLVHGYKLT